jgi:tetratricopeptide (TPR) repeat protein
MRHHLSIVVFALTVAAGVAPARSTEEISPDSCGLWGQIVIPGRSLQQPTVIEIIGKDSALSRKIPVINGNFNSSSLPPGLYQIRLSDPSGPVLYKETKALSGAQDEMVILVPQPVLRDTNIVSVAVLKRETPRKARDELNAASKATQNGNMQEGVKHLLKALDIDPQYPEARINLAVDYALMGRHLEALQQGQKAFEIDSGGSEVGERYAKILLMNKKYRECETVARSMIKKQYYTAEMKAALAVSLIGQRRNLEEALAYLRQAAAEVPRARALAANALWEIGWREEAVNQVRTYLNSSANPCERPHLESWIAEHSKTQPFTENSH